MSIIREFKLYLNAGREVPLVINVNQYDQNETWKFKLYNDDGTQFYPDSGAIVGIKSDGNLIANAGTIDGNYVVITETEQMTASAGTCLYELQIDGETHGTANFYVEVEADPSEGGVASGSDISLLRRAISGGMSDTAITALLACFRNVAWINDQGQTYYQALSDALLMPEIESISAVYTQSGTVYSTDLLASLADDLVVTALYENGTEATIPYGSYTLSGTLNEGTSEVTVSYSEKTTTFNVTVTAVTETVLFDGYYGNESSTSNNLTPFCLYYNSVYDYGYPTLVTAFGLNFTSTGTFIVGYKPISEVTGNVSVKNYTEYETINITSTGYQKVSLSSALTVTDGNCLAFGGTAHFKFDGSGTKKGFYYANSSSAFKTSSNSLGIDVYGERLGE